MRVQAKIQKWGNSLGLRLAGSLRSIPHFEANMLVNIDVTEEGLQIYPAKNKAKKMLSEKQLLADLTPHKAHASEIATLSPKEILDSNN